MSHLPPPSPDCEAVSDDLLEFSLGTLSGPSRSAVLEHLDSCARCRAELASTATVTDALLWLAPEAEPPLGFDTRLVSRLHEGDVVRPIHRARRLVELAAAALLIAVVAFGIGAVVTGGRPAPSPAAAGRPLMAQLTSNGKVLGQVFVTPGRPSWLAMTFDDAKWSGAAWCQVTLRDGRVETVGKFWLENGYGAWTVKVAASGAQIRTAQLVDAHGTVLALAALPT